MKIWKIFKNRNTKNKQKKSSKELLLATNSKNISTNEKDEELNLLYEEINHKECQNKYLKKQNEELLTTISAIKNVNNNNPSSDVQIEFIIEKLLPKVNFLRDSVDRIAKLSEIGRVLDITLNISNKKNIPGSKKLSGDLRNWVECRYQTGNSNNAGRIYFRINAKNTDILISIKKQQERDINYLRTRTST